MSTDLQLDEIGPWSEIKLEIVRKYAAAYSTILANQPAIKGHLYIDGFAGAGTHVSKATGQDVPGSPTIALKTEPSFKELHFVDLDGARTAELTRLSEGDPRVTVHHGDCNDVLLREVFPRCRYADFRRGLCLLDPYKLNIDWSVLEAAGKMRSIEVFYNFMIMDANMNMLMHDPSKVAPEQSARMTAVWGDESWRQGAYRRTPDLFGGRDEKVSNAEIAEAFRLRLKNVAGFAYVPEPLPMRNSKGAVVYYLYFASPNATGGDIVSEIFNKYRHTGAR
jgi:three-Cys-motif partner protein